MRSAPARPNSFIASAVFSAPLGMDANRSATFGRRSLIGRIWPLASRKSKPSCWIIFAVASPDWVAVVRFRPNRVRPFVKVPTSTPEAFAAKRKRDISSAVPPATRCSLTTSPAAFLNVSMDAAANFATPTAASTPATATAALRTTGSIPAVMPLPMPAPAVVPAVVAGPTTCPVSAALIPTVVGTMETYAVAISFSATSPPV